MMETTATFGARLPRQTLLRDPARRGVTGRVSLQSRRLSSESKNGIGLFASDVG
jgi:hypothetical protein